MREVTEEQLTEFVNEMHTLFSKHADVMQAADKKLAEQDLEGFKQSYASLPIADLIEIVQAQHIKTNELYGQFKQRGDVLMQVFRDISGCKDFIEFDTLKKKARSILLAQDMVDRGKSAEEVIQAMQGEKPIEKPSSDIILHA